MGKLEFKDVPAGTEDNKIDMSTKISTLNLQENLKDRFVAFIDVLGFKELVKSGNIENLETYFNRITEVLDKLRIRKAKVESFLISDSIILIAPPGNTGLRQLLEAIRTIQSSLLWKKILLRGAVSYGPVYYNAERNIIVGMGFIKAYLLEKEAIHPRIIIDPAIIKLGFNDKAGFLKQMNGSTDYNFEHRLIYSASEFAKINDDGIFIDYANKIIKESEVTGNLERTYDMIRENLYSDQRLYAKYVWLRDYFVECLKLSYAIHQKNQVKPIENEQIINTLFDWKTKFNRL
jgi:hypothetical protein